MTTGNASGSGVAAPNDAKVLTKADSATDPAKQLRDMDGLTLEGGGPGRDSKRSSRSRGADDKPRDSKRSYGRPGSRGSRSSRDRLDRKDSAREARPSRSSVGSLKKDKDDKKKEEDDKKASSSDGFQ